MPDGAVTLHYDTASRRVSLALHLWGLAAASAYVVHVHRGSCLNPSDAVAVTFPSVTSDAKGTILTSIAAAHESSIAILGAAYLDLHLVGATSANSPSPESAVPVACTDVPKNATSATLAWYATPGHKPSGSATLTFDGDRHVIDARLNLSVLSPHSVQVVEIDAGSCTALGTVVTRLTDITADAQGSVQAKQTLEHVDMPLAGAWAVVVRAGPPPGAASGGQGVQPLRPILCGEVERAQKTSTPSPAGTPATSASS
jgi:hypothetical protein